MISDVLDGFHESAYRHMMLRTAVYNRMYEWSPSADPNEHPMLLANLVGRSTQFSPLLPMTAAEAKVCESLLGEHGYAVYRMLLARWLPHE